MILLWVLVPVVVTIAVVLFRPHRGEFYEVERRNRAMEKMSEWSQPR